MSVTPPIRVLQFGTGRLLRGLCADVFDRAHNDPAVPWEGSVGAVQSTGSHRADAINAAGGRFVLRTRGVRAGEAVDEERMVSGVSRAFGADRDWADVLAAARSADLDLIISNTTESGLQEPGAADELETGRAPGSYVGKLLAVLVARFRARPGAPLTVVPCELVEGNGGVLRAAVLGHAARCRVDDEAAGWLDSHVRFADSLVDRICTAPDVDANPLDTVAEPYGLWAIRDDRGAVGPLAFAGCGGFVGGVATVHADIDPFYARKVRVLNGAHIAVVHLGLLAGLETVGEVMSHAQLRLFLDALLDREVLPALGHDGIEGGAAFAEGVVDRFSNPFLRHALVEIENGSAQKVGIRLAPTAVAHTARTGGPPELVTLSLGAWSERSRSALLASRGAETVLGAPVDGPMGESLSDPASFARALLVSSGIRGAFEGAVETGAVGECAARLAADGVGAAIGSVL